jgi:hypothetical protein
MRNKFLIVVGTLVTAFQSLLVFGMALGATGDESWSDVMYQQLTWSVVLGFSLAIFLDYKSPSKIWKILIPPAGFLAFMGMGMIEEYTQGNTAALSELHWLRIPLAISIPAFLIPTIAKALFGKQAV